MTEEKQTTLSEDQKNTNAHGNGPRVSVARTDLKNHAGEGDENSRDKQFGAKKVFVGRRPRKGRQEKFKPEFDQKILGIRRVTRVMAGGRRFSFSVSMAVGDRKGRVGVGIGKGSDTAVAIEKAFNSAKKNMITLSLKENMSIPFTVDAKFCASRVVLMPAPGKGLVAGGTVRSVLDLAGVRDVSAKILSRSKNALNNARVCMEALEKLHGSKAKKETTENKSAKDKGEKNAREE